MCTSEGKVVLPACLYAEYLIAALHTKQTQAHLYFPSCISHFRNCTFSPCLLPQPLPLSATGKAFSGPPRSGFRSGEEVVAQGADCKPTSWSWRESKGEQRALLPNRAASWSPGTAGNSAQPCPEPGVGMSILESLYSPSVTASTHLLGNWLYTEKRTLQACLRPLRPDVLNFPAK